MSSPRTIRWGILATGGIATTFARDLTVDPKTRDVTSIKHSIVAASSSSSSSRAQDFLNEVGAPSSAKAYGSYKELVADPEVEIIYIATPHSHHYQCAMLCLEAGKHVLCEKSFTVNAAQAKILAKKAREKDLFLMEAVWTRYFPLSQYIRDLIASGTLGPVTRVSADLSANSRPETSWPDDTHRLVNPSLAGGALLDLGIYALTWLFISLYSTQTTPAARRAPPRVHSATRTYRTGVDDITTILLSFPRSDADGGDAHGIATTSFRVASDPDGRGSAGPAVRIQGVEGEAQVFHPIYRPTRTRVITSDGTIEEKTWTQPGPGAGSGWFNGFGKGRNAEGEGHGMFWEADEAGLALLEGRKEGRQLGLEESVVIMEVMDEVRRQAGVVYPEAIESTEYPLDL